MSRTSSLHYLMWDTSQGSRLLLQHCIRNPSADVRSFVFCLLVLSLAPRTRTENRRRWNCQGFRQPQDGEGTDLMLHSSCKPPGSYAAFKLVDHARRKPSERQRSSVADLT